MEFENYPKARRAQLMISDQYKHSLIYTPDAGQARRRLETPLGFQSVGIYQRTAPVNHEGNCRTAAVEFGAKPSYMVLQPLDAADGRALQRRYKRKRGNALSERFRLSL